MRLHHQFDLDTENVKRLGRDLFALPPYIVEELLITLRKKGYTVLKSSADFMGIPKSITVVKEFTGPFVTMFSAKMKKDFNFITKKLGIERLFQ
mgnify:FL=1